MIGHFFSVKRKESYNLIFSMFSLVLNFQKDSCVVNVLVHFRPTLRLYDVFLFIDLKLAKDIAKVAYTYYKYAPQELTF